MNVKFRHALTDRIALALADFAINRPWLTIASSLLVFAIAASGLQGIKFANNYRIFFSAENPELLAFENFQETYTKNDNISFYVEPKNGEVFSPEVAAAIEQLTEEAWQIPHALRVDSITNFQYSWADGDDLTVENLIRNGAALSQEILNEKRDIAIGEPLLYRNLVAEDLAATGVNVVLHYPEKSQSEVPDAVSKARQIAAKIRAQYPDLFIGLTGISMLNNAFAEAAQRDSRTLLPIMFLILVVVTLLVLRSFSATVATMSVVVLAAATAMGVVGHVGTALAPIALAAPIVIMTLAVADSVHILVSMLTLMRDGKTKLDALRESLRINFLAITITSVTTMIGFLALNFSDAPPFRHLGNITAVGIAAAWLYSVTFLPAVMRLLPVKTRKVEGELTKSEFAMERLAAFVTARYRPILLAGLVVSGSLIAVLPQIELNDQWVEYFDKSTSFRQDADRAIQHMPGAYRVEFSVGAGGPEDINNPEYLRNLDKFANWMRTQNNVEHVYSYTDVIKRLNKNMHGDDEAYFRLPDDQKLAAQYLFLYEISLPFGLDLNDRINVDKSATRVTTTLRQVNTSEMKVFLADTQSWMEENLPEHMRAKATSSSVMFTYIAERNIESMFAGNAIAVILISLILVFALRSPGLGALSILPNVVPILMTYGIWTILVGRIGMAAAVVSATSLGIIVDDTVHFLSKYIRARREHGYDQAQAIEYAFKTVGLALIANSIILVAGFSFLMQSTFRANVEMGALTAIAITVALAFDMLVLPALLLIGYRKKTSEGTHDENEPALQPAA